jgi:hypothetical protein
MPFRSTVPLRAMVLWSIIVPGFGIGGLIVGTWVLPLGLTIAHGDPAALNEIWVERHLFARTPTWIDAAGDSTLYDIVGLGTAVMAFLGAASFGVLGLRLWQYLIVRRFKWMTEEEVQEARKRQRQIM